MHNAETLSQEIGIIGINGRFPMARNIDEYWRNLRDGVEAISTFSEHELEGVGIERALLDDPNYVRANGMLEDADLFDASFFGFTPRESEIMDPQHRIFLECAWQAFEEAGYNTEKYDGRIGLFAGVSVSSYLLVNLLSDRELLRSVGGFQTMIGNDKDHLASRVSYKLNLKGPSIIVQTACSTSLVAVHLACQMLLNGECDMVLAGGASIKFPQITGYLYQEGGIASPDGHCRAFDANAQGTVSGSGVGVVILKRLVDAIADGDTIHAIIKGSAINNDGSLKAGYTAPSESGQAEVIAEALAMAEIDPETITYIETHGSGTLLGDPIELAALTQAFRASTEKKNFCAIGSVKTNIGHLDAAAGVAGLIKTVLALKHKMIPPSLNFQLPNPKIDFQTSPFYVNSSLAPWPAGNTPRRAGVSSFGMGGTNAHLILEEAPVVRTAGESRPYQLLMLSAQTRSALDQQTRNLVEHLKQHPEIALADVAYTLQVGRREFNHRRLVLCSGVEEAVTALETPRAARVYSSIRESGQCAVAFMFPGLGDQYPNMSLGLYEQEKAFREQVDQCALLLKPQLKLDIREVLFPPGQPPHEPLAEPASPSGRRGLDLRKLLQRVEPHSDESSKKLNQTYLTQPAVFVVEYSLAQLMMKWGIRPTAMIGYSIGEFVAACIAGVFSLEEALLLIAGRARLIQELEVGAMLAVALSEEKTRPLLGESLTVAAINSSSLCVVSGPVEDVVTLEQQLTEKGEVSRRIQTSHAFHSKMMEPILDRFLALAKTIKLQPPQIPFVSNVTGKWITAEEATDPAYWGKHLCQAVRFDEGMTRMLEEPERVLVEIGPGQTLGGLALQHPNLKQGQVVVSALRHRHDQQSDSEYLLAAVGRLWLAGAEVKWGEYYGNERRQRIKLPTYPFERQRYWVPEKKQLSKDGPKKLGKRPDLADWFYVSSWRQSGRSTKFSPLFCKDQKSTWLVFLNAHGLGLRLAQRLEANAQTVIRVSTGEQFAMVSENSYTINPQQAGDYEALINDLVETGNYPQKIAHLWSVSEEHGLRAGFETNEKKQVYGFYSLLFLSQALGNCNLEEPIHLAVVTNNLYDISGAESLCPDGATVLGPTRVIAQECPNITCCNIDLQLPSGLSANNRLVEQLLEEIAAPTSDVVVAYRGQHRWVQTFEPIKLGAVEDGSTALREDGVYLITGGMGGIGMVLAQYLAKTARVKLVLTGRSAFPAREAWEEWLAIHDEKDEVSRRIRELQDLEKLGAVLQIASADVADEKQMRAVIEEAHQRFGQINGVIHAAGVAGGGLLQLKTPEMAASVMAAKVRGTLVLENLFKDENLDFLVLCSSMSAILGGLGEVDYCAANAFLDAFAHYHSSRYGIPTISINWDVWQEAGLAVNTLAPRGLAQQRADSIKQGILNSEGSAAFGRILANPLPQIVVSTRDLQTVIEQHHTSNASLAAEELEQAYLAKPTHPRPAVAQEYVVPGNELEETLVGIWQELLGIDQIGVNDNFFELGGHSLLATLLLSRLRQVFQVNLPLRAIFTASTVAELAVLLEELLLTEIEDLTETEAVLSAP
jgi:acyl transferase domain-containing protein/acyl carrier protein